MRRGAAGEAWDVVGEKCSWRGDGAAQNGLRDAGDDALGAPMGVAGEMASLSLSGHHSPRRFISTVYAPRTSSSAMSQCNQERIAPRIDTRTHPIVGCSFAPTPTL